MSHFSGLAGPGGPILNVHIGLSVPRIQAMQSAGVPLPATQLAQLLIDTGASHTVIDDRFVQLLGLQPTGTVSMLTPSTGATPHQAATYDVAMYVIGHASAIHHLPVQPVTACPMSHQGIDGLIGRDILAAARLTYSGPDNFFYLSF